VRLTEGLPEKVGLEAQTGEVAQPMPQSYCGHRKRFTESGSVSWKAAMVTGTVLNNPGKVMFSCVFPRKLWLPLLLRGRPSRTVPRINTHINLGLTLSHSVVQLFKQNVPEQGMFFPTSSTLSLEE
jgi:hypothetical protein